MAANFDINEFTAARLSAQLPGLGQALTDLANNLSPQVSSETVTTTANCDVTIYETSVTIAGADYTVTLPNGSYVGQRKLVRCGVTAGTNKVTLTVTTPESATGAVCAGTFIMDTAGQGVEFIWASTGKWRAHRVMRAGIKATTCGTTDLAGYNLAAMYVITCTGTNASTSTKGIPNGSAVGEAIYLGVTSAGGTTGATYTITARKADGTAGTTLTLSSATATADCSSYVWDGALWVPTFLAASAAIS